ncbi:MAG: ABC transporter permease [Candidatus Omnitrophica bacterium CG11_big_fil_rev_8_21_14_0_20_42_13]|uniref:ABC transporter permease n=1 Tax=Candidatus Ghiorseimicrobium undicola TaxID=1974746 RepID=A0A2H0LZQ0_9BACT|nr:MAG: ABC transporter permease [Candidatus Omnitrophica bacterium CG11_big_fil_rev_8_21_14_0_20_42_13]
MNNRLKLKIALLFFILFAAIIIGVLKGPADLGIRQLLSRAYMPILYLRALRIFAALSCGAGLAVSGIALQAILRNPLAEPYLLGTSSGAGLGAVIALICGIASRWLPLFAFLGAALSIFIVYNLARQNNRIRQESLILSGVIVSVAFSAIIVFLVSISGSEVLRSLSWWLWGSLQVYDARLLLIVSIIVFAGVLVIYLFAQDLNAISIGEEEAMHLGINAEQTKKILIFTTSIITASLVCVCGVIGFVGLIAPHTMRLLCGPNHRVLIPVTCLGAAIFMILCDIIARVIYPPLEVPIGVITAMVGAPIFIILLRRSEKI